MRRVAAPSDVARECDGVTWTQRSVAVRCGAVHARHGALRCVTLATMPPSKALNLRLPPDVAELLARAHRGVGRAIPRHRLAIIALARGLAGIIEAPARVLEGLPVIEASGDSREEPPPPTTSAEPRAERGPKRAAPRAGGNRGKRRASPSKAPPKPSTSTAPSVVTAEALAELAGDLAAFRVSSGLSLRAIVAGARVPSRSAFQAWLKAREKGEEGNLSPNAYKALRAFVPARATLSNETGRGTP